MVQPTTSLWVLQKVSPMCILFLLSPLFLQGECSTITTNINAANSWGKTPLYLAAKNNHPRIVEYLLQQGANFIQYTQQNDYTPLRATKNVPSLEMIQVIMQHAQKNWLQLDRDEQSLFYQDITWCLYQAIKENNEKMAKLIVKFLPKDGGKNQQILHKALHAAIAKPFVPLIQFLHEQGTLIEKKYSIPSPLSSALQQAASTWQDNYDQIVDYFFEQEINDPNEMSEEGKTLLYYAVKANNNKWVTQLLKAGAQPNIYNEVSSPLHQARSFDIAEKLIEHNANVNARTINHKLTPLLKLAQRYKPGSDSFENNNNIRIANLLLRKEANVNAARDPKENFTALTASVEKNNLDKDSTFLNKILSYGANPHLPYISPNSQSYTLSDIADEKNGNDAVIKWLKMLEHPLDIPFKENQHLKFFKNLSKAQQRASFANWLHYPPKEWLELDLIPQFKDENVKELYKTFRLLDTDIFTLKTARAFIQLLTQKKNKSDANPNTKKTSPSNKSDAQRIKTLYDFARRYKIKWLVKKILNKVSYAGATTPRSPKGIDDLVGVINQYRS